MKKLSALVALILCATIGGVYASWIYANEGTETFHSVELSIGLEAKFEGAIGTYKIVVEDGSVTPFRIAPLSNDDYTATFKVEKKVYLEFKPTSKASDDIQTNGVTTYLYYLNAAALEGYTFGGDQIFTYTKYTLDNATDKYATITMSSADKQGDTFRVDITDIFRDSIDFIDGVTLPNYDDYTEFENAFKKGGMAPSFSVKVTNLIPA